MPVANKEHFLYLHQSKSENIKMFISKTNEYLQFVQFQKVLQ